MNLSVSPSSPVNHAVVTVSAVRRPSHAKLAGVLGAACGLGTLLTVPFSNALLPSMHLGAGVAVLTSGLQGALLFLLAWAGLRMGSSLGLDMPVLRARLEGRRVEGGVARALAVSLGVGLVLGAIALGLANFCPRPPVMPPHVARWMGLLASLGGPFVEEVTCRLFLMTLLTSVASKITGSCKGGVYFFGNAVAALGFAAMHIPQAVSIFGAVSPGLLVFILGANGLVGMACGYLFRRKGLGHAIAAHMGADLVLHFLVTT